MVHRFRKGSTVRIARDYPLIGTLKIGDEGVVVSDVINVSRRLLVSFGRPLSVHAQISEDIVPFTEDLERLRKDVVDPLEYHVWLPPEILSFAASEKENNEDLLETLYMVLLLVLQFVNE